MSGDETIFGRMALLTAQFGDTDWIELLLARARAVFPELVDDRIYVIDQNRTAESRRRLATVLGAVRILEYPRSEPHVVMTGHDHAHALNLAVRDVDSEYLMIVDSDAHPVSDRSRARLAELMSANDAVLAAWDPTGTRTHPCFMLVGPGVDRGRLSFDEGQLEVGVDTGRLIFDQVRAMGRAAELIRPRPAFGGRWGTLYLDGTIYHHGSGSFRTNPDPRLQAQAAYRRSEREFYKRRVFAGRYELSPAEAVVASVLRARWTLPAQAGRAARRLGAPVRRRLRPASRSGA